MHYCASRAPHLFHPFLPNLPFPGPPPWNAPPFQISSENTNAYPARGLGVGAAGSWDQEPQLAF